MTPNKTMLDLKTAIQTWLNRDDPEVVSAIPQFIELATQEFSRSVKIPMDEGAFIYFPTSDETTGVQIPTDCLSPIGVWVTKPTESGVNLPESYTRIDGFAYFDIFKRNNGKSESEREAGRFFCKYQNQFLFYPAMNSGDILEITYHKDLTPLVTDTDTNASLLYGFDLMLYWSLKHASVFLRDLEQEQYWTQKAQEAALTMQNTFEELHWGGSPLQILGY